MSSTYKIMQSDKEFEEVWDFLKSVTKGSAKDVLPEELTPVYKPSFNLLVKQGEEVSLYHAFASSEHELKVQLNEAGMLEDNNLTTGERHFFTHEYQAKSVIDKYLQLIKEGYPKTVEYPEGQE